MKKYLIHVQAIYPALIAGFFVYFLSFFLLRFIILPRYANLTAFILWFGTVWSVLFILDSVQRFRHYRSAVDYLRHESADFKKLLEHEKIAWCTRESAKAACRQHGEHLYKEAIIYYRERGYSYYNILPENFFKKDSPVFKHKYWRSAFFDIRSKNYLKDLHK